MKIFTALLVLLPFMVFGQEPEDLPYIRNDNFVSNTFGFPARIKNFKKYYGSKFTITKNPIRNRHDSTLVDTIYSFSMGRTKIEFYKTRQYDFLQYANIETGKIPLKYNIKVGVGREEVTKRLKTAITADKVQVGDLERGQVYTLTFSRGKLTSILYEAYLD